MAKLGIIMCHFSLDPLSNTVYNPGELFLVHPSISNFTDLLYRRPKCPISSFVVRWLNWTPMSMN
jgi:hypothetical protein